MRSSLTPAVLTTAIVALSCISCPADQDSGSLEFLDGGSLSCSTELSLGFLYGAGGRPDGLGAPVSTMRSGVASVSGNPAGLAFLATHGLLIDVLPPLSASVSDLADLESRTASMIDDAIEEFAAEGLEPIYPELDVMAGQQAGVISGAMALRIGPFVAGAAIEEPLSIALDLIDAGMEAFAGAVKHGGEGDVDIEMRCFGDAAVDVLFNVDRTTLGAGAEIAPGIGVGVSVSRYHASAGMSGVVRADGIVNYGGQEYAFNDPDDPWQNDLGLSAAGAFEGSAYGWSAGASWRATDCITVDVLYNSVPPLTLNGELTTVENMIPAAADGGFHLEEISALQPTLTERTETVEDDPVTLFLPSYAGAAISFRTGTALTTLEYRVYSGLVGFEYQDYSEGVELSDGAGVEVDFGGFWVGGGVVRGTLVVDSASGESGDDVLIPLANMGMGFDLGSNMTLDTLFLAVPLQVARVSLSYEF